jgi:hypothetical protein
MDHGMTTPQSVYASVLAVGNPLSRAAGAAT